MGQKQRGMYIVEIPQLPCASDLQWYELMSWPQQFLESIESSTTPSPATPPGPQHTHTHIHPLPSPKHTNTHTVPIIKITNC